MRILTSICRWLSSGFVGLVVSCVALACFGLAYETLNLQERLGVDDDICWLGLIVGPALIVVIHRGFHRKVWMSVMALIGGMALAGVGVFLFASANEAKTHLVPSGPFSGIEHAFAVVLSLFLMLVAAFAILAGGLALVARRMSRRCNIQPPRTSG